MKEITLTRGFVAQVDDTDFAWLNNYKWCISGDSKYAVRGFGPRNNRRLLFMHKEILVTNQTVDHIDGNKLNNQRSNLRLATKAQNSMNRGLQRNNTHGYKGVCPVKGKWQAYIKVGGKKIHLGTFLNKEQAALCYNNAAVKYFGAFAQVNDVSFIS